MVKLMKKGKLIICPHEEKMKILSSRKLEDGFINTRFMTKEEFFQHYFYTYDIENYKQDPGLNFDFESEEIGKYHLINRKNLNI